MVAGRHSTLLADASRQVQIADHLLTVTYPMVKDPKLLMSIIEHLRRAVEDAADAVVEFHIHRGEYELPKHAVAGQQPGKHDVLVAFSDLVHVRNPNIPGALEAVEACRELTATAQHFKEAPVSFPRDEKLVIADHDYALEEVTQVALKANLHTVKQFVHGVQRHLLLTGEAVR
jgi:hypothetical protein